MNGTFIDSLDDCEWIYININAYVYRRPWMLEFDCGDICSGGCPVHQWLSDRFRDPQTIHFLWYGRDFSCSKSRFLLGSTNLNNLQVTRVSYL